jgi:adenylate cyclase
MGIAVMLIVVMAITAVLTMMLVMQVGSRIEELTYRYIPAYGDLPSSSASNCSRLLRRLVIGTVRGSLSRSRFIQPVRASP